MDRTSRRWWTPIPAHSKVLNPDPDPFPDLEPEPLPDVAFVGALCTGGVAGAGFGIGAETTGMTPSPISFPDFAENSIDFRNLSKSGVSPG